MKIDLQHINNNCRTDQLRTVEHELTEEDIDFYNQHGWKNFREEDLIKTYLPEIGPPIYFSTLAKGVVIEIKGKRYRFTFEEDHYFDPYEADGKSITLTPTNDPLTLPDANKENYYLKFFGQPEWVQTSWYPADLNGNPCYHLVTIESGWGDNGNYNILIGFNENNEPNVAYFEASCC